MKLFAPSPAVPGVGVRDATISARQLGAAAVMAHVRRCWEEAGALATAPGKWPPHERQERPEQRRGGEKMTTLSNTHTACRELGKAGRKDAETRPSHSRERRGSRDRKRTKWTAK